MALARSKREKISARTAHRSVQVADGPQLDSTGAGGILPEYEFEIDYLDSRGRRWTGHFTARALTNRDRFEAGLIKAKLANGIPLDSLDLHTANLLEMLAVIEVATQTRPDWAGDFLDLFEPDVMNEIYKEIVGFEDRFHGPDTREASSDADGDPKRDRPVPSVEEDPKTS